MSGASITGSREVVVKFKMIKSRAENPQRVWRSVGKYVSGEVRKQFSSQGSYFGTPWKPLSPQYRAWKLSHGHGGRMLVLTGDLRKSFIGRPMDVERYQGKTAVFGSSSKTAAWHQRGTKNQDGTVKMPARPILVLTRNMRKDISDILAKYIAQGRMS